MATKGKKISDVSVADSLDGSELIPFVKNGGDGAMRTETVKDYIKGGLNIPTKTSELTNDSGYVTSADVNIQSDWDVEDASSGAYIKNKPGVASPTTNGLMSAADKAKLDSACQMTILTMAEYNALENKDANTAYLIRE